MFPRSPRTLYFLHFHSFPVSFGCSSKIYPAYRYQTLLSTFSETPQGKQSFTAFQKICVRTVGKGPDLFSLQGFSAGKTFAIHAQ